VHKVLAKEQQNIDVKNANVLVIVVRVVWKKTKNFTRNYATKNAKQRPNLNLNLNLDLNLDQKPDQRLDQKLDLNLDQRLDQKLDQENESIHWNQMIINEIFLVVYFRMSLTITCFRKALLYNHHHSPDPTYLFQLNHFVVCY